MPKKQTKIVRSRVGQTPVIVAQTTPLAARVDVLARQRIVNNARLANALRKATIADARLQLMAAMCRSY